MKVYIWKLTIICILIELIKESITESDVQNLLIKTEMYTLFCSG